MELQLQLNEVMKTHWQWVEQMGWHNKSDLEALALCFSEVGEAYDEYVSRNPAELLIELADIVLRVGDLLIHSARTAPGDAMQAPLLIPTKNRPAILLAMVSMLAMAVNDARHTPQGALSQECVGYLGNVLRLCFYLADLDDADLLQAIDHKIQVNATRGTRGRKI